MTSARSPQAPRSPRASQAPHVPRPAGPPAPATDHLVPGDLVPAAVRDVAAAASPDELPAYVYDLAGLRAHVAGVRGALPDGVELYYAAKANPERAVLAELARPAGGVDGFEVASAGELAHVRAAVPGRPVAFGGPGKTPGEIARALAAGTDRFHVESLHELRLLTAEADRQRRTADILLRVNLPVAGVTLSGAPLAMGGGPGPFGLDPAGFHACLAHLAALGPGARVRARGVHAHLASGLDAAGLAALAGGIVTFATGPARAAGLPVEEVDVGGGMAVDYGDPAARFDWRGYGAALGRLLDRHPGLTLRIEPGRALTAYCGWYVTEVLDVKSAHGEDFAVLRGGTHHLRTPAAKGHDQPFAVLPREQWPHPWPRPATRGPAGLVGQLCTPKDVLARRVPLPAGGLRAGDRVAFAMAGAYAWNISHHEFLMHPAPRFHFVGGRG
ncbi:type III PLP-dependent enzyme [Streptomyces sp. SL13]|uniref:Type III PLP-dependent enzyme n=1 Tax=Streptantibioticus silvisoli TaxID=2705255 RepID=A0AA90GYE6_9ACTN|nr:type III PLP-dependent enzyme [Streptantibioticus silvisoli]MDI5970488.1 type III PLP-dependent enzyme [Streptantibioticus silvisoli]